MLYYLDKDIYKKQIKKSLNAENFGFLFTRNHKDLYSCSCGSHGRQKIFKDFSCPSCGNKLFFMVDGEQDSALLRYDYEILRNDNIFVMGLSAKGVDIDNEDFIFDSYEIDNIFIVYFRKNDLFGIFRINDIYGFLKETDDDFIPHVYSDLIRFENKNGFEIYMVPIKELYRENHFYADIEWDKNILKHTGLIEIKEELLKAMPKVSKEIDDENLDSLLSHFFIEINFPLKKTTCSVLISRTYNYEFILKDYCRLLEAGVNVKESDPEKAFGIDIDSIYAITSFDMLEDIKLFNKIVKDEGIENYVSHYNINILDKQLILHLAKKQPQIPLRAIIKHVMRGVQEGEKICTIVKNDEEILDDKKFCHMLDLNAPYSKHLYTKYYVAKNNILTEDEFDDFIHTPTLNTMFNIINKKN